MNAAASPENRLFFGSDVGQQAEKTGSGYKFS
jgi:hypothetical protein